MENYINSFFDAKIMGSTPTILASGTPLEYKGYMIYKRTSYCFDIVKDGVCIGMNAGLNGAKRRIDNLTT